MTYIRMVMELQDPDSGKRSGIFHAARLLTDNPETEGYLLEAMKKVLMWFADNLEVPSRFNKSKSKGYYRKVPKGISWFRDDSNTCILKAFELKALIEEAGIPITLIKTDKPGYIVYEDEHQIVAEPFKDTLC